MNPNEFITIKVKEISRYKLKALAAAKGESMSDIFEEIVDEKCKAERIVLPKLEEIEEDS